MNNREKTDLLLNSPESIVKDRFWHQNEYPGKFLFQYNGKLYVTYVGGRSYYTENYTGQNWP